MTLREKILEAFPSYANDEPVDGAALVDWVKDNIIDLIPLKVYTFDFSRHIEETCDSLVSKVRVRAESKAKAIRLLNDAVVKVQDKVGLGKFHTTVVEASQRFCAEREVIDFPIIEEGFDSFQIVRRYEIGFGY